MPEAGGEDRSTERTGADPAADSGYSEWISEVRRLYVEPKGSAELHFVAEEDEDAPAPAKGRGRRLGRGRRSQQATAAPAAPAAAAAESATPARPSLADLMAARAEGPATSAPRFDAATSDGSAGDHDRAWPSSTAEDPEPAFEPWPVAVRDETVEDDTVEDDPARDETVEDARDTRPEPTRSPAPTVDEGWPEAPPPALPGAEAPAGTPPRVGSEQAWIAALADAAATAPATGGTPATDGTVTPGATGAPDDTPAPEGTRSWWDETPLDDVEAGSDPAQPVERAEQVERAQPVSPPPVTEAPARRSSWFDEALGADPTDEGGIPLPDPLADGASEHGTGLAAGAISVDPTDDEPGTPAAPAPGAPRTRAEVRAATRQAERTRRARRRRALVAAVVLLVVVAAAWFVLRPHGSASAGASTTRHPVLAVATQPLTPPAL